MEAFIRLTRIKKRNIAWQMNGDGTRQSGGRYARASLPHVDRHRKILRMHAAIRATAPRDCTRNAKKREASAIQFALHGLSIRLPLEAAIRATEITDFGKITHKTCFLSSEYKNQYAIFSGLQILIRITAARNKTKRKSHIKSENR